MKYLFAPCAALALLLLSWGASAQVWPDRPIKLIVPFGAGGATDLTARTLGTRMAKELGQPVVVENRPGAGGNIGLDAVAKSPADGYTLVFAGSEMTSNPSLYKQMKFDAGKDFRPVSQITQMPSLLVVRAESPIKSVPDLVARAKAEPGVLTYASGGNGTINHFNAELLKVAAGNVDVLHVPYKSSQDMLTSVLAGQTSFTFVTPASAGGQIKAGKLRVLASTGRVRSPQYPEAPTMRELFKPGFEIYGWGGLLAPAGTPQPVIDQLTAAIAKSLADPAVRTTLNGAGFEVLGSSSQEFTAQINKELAEWPVIVKLSGAKID